MRLALRDDSVSAGVHGCVVGHLGLQHLLVSEGEVVAEDSNELSIHDVLHAMSECVMA